MKRRRLALALRAAGPLLWNARARCGFGADAPLVSVVVATYNWSSVLRYSLRTALWQTYPNIEVLVVGDGCTDDSAEVVASFGDKRLSWRNLETNSGSQSAPNNAGIDAARGTHIAYLGHDDLWLPSHLSLLVKRAIETKADVVYSVTQMIGPPRSRLLLLRGLRRYRAGDPIAPSSLLHRRSLVAEMGPWLDYRTLVAPPDLEFVHRAHDSGASISGLHALTVFKFPSLWRPRSYIEKPTYQQAEYVRRMEHERGFVFRELAAAVAARLLGPRWLPSFPQAPDPLPPGWLVTEARRIRGLEEAGLLE